MGGIVAVLTIAVIATMVYNFTRSGSGGPSEVSSITSFGTNVFGDLVGK